MCAVTGEFLATYAYELHIAELLHVDSELNFLLLLLQ